jgi:hypothetical protein
MSETLPSLVQDRTKVLRQISQLGDLRPGSVSSVLRRCGKPNCHCAQPQDPGHGPHAQLSYKVDGKTVTAALPSPAAVRKAQREIAEFRKFEQLRKDLIQVNQQICRLRPVEQDEPGVWTPQEKKRRRRSIRRSPEK